MWLVLLMGVREGVGSGGDDGGGGGDEDDGA